jgi:adenine/guanine phosphoribosyltransferase-like PRPP-binding protein
MVQGGQVEPTTGYWQEILSDATPEAAPPGGIYRFRYPARLPDGRILMLPIRRRPHTPNRGVASLIVNHASFEVVDALAAFMADLARPFEAEVVVGMPTLGLSLAAPMARLLGHRSYVPLGYSRKYWYEDRLSEPVSSITTPQGGRAVYLDPNLIPRLSGRRAVIVDDAISTGSTAVAVLRLLGKTSVRPVGMVFAMSQGGSWTAQLGDEWQGRIRWVFESPLLRAVAGGWAVDAPD